MAGISEPARSACAFTPASQAKRLLGIDPRTARKRIANGELPGFITPGDKVDHYFFYTDSPTDNANSEGRHVGSVNSEVTALREQLDAANQSNSELHNRLASTEAKLAAAEEAKRVLLATNSFTIDAAKKIRAGSEDLFKAVELQRDLLAQFITPDDLQNLPVPDL